MILRTKCDSLGPFDQAEVAAVLKCGRTVERVSLLRWSNPEVTLLVESKHGFRKSVESAIDSTRGDAASTQGYEFVYLDVSSSSSSSSGQTLSRQFVFHSRQCRSQQHQNRSWKVEMLKKCKGCSPALTLVAGAADLHCTQKTLLEGRAAAAAAGITPLTLTVRKWVH